MHAKFGRKTWRDGRIDVSIIWKYTLKEQGTWWRSFLRHCRKVAGSIPGGIIGIFHWLNPSGRNVALGSTQPLTEISTRNISWAAMTAGSKVWQTYHFHVPAVMKTVILSLLETSQPLQAWNRSCFSFNLKEEMHVGDTRVGTLKVATI